MAHGEPAERKRLLRTWVQEVKLAPERLEVEITYQIPEPVMNGVVAGAGFVSEKKTRLSWRTREIGFRLDSRRVSRRRGTLALRIRTAARAPNRAKVAGSERGQTARCA
jgi:hypothetical protein